MLWVLVSLDVGSRRKCSYDLQMELALSYIQIVLQNVQYEMLGFRLCLFVITYHMADIFVSKQSDPRFYSNYHQTHGRLQQW